MELKNFNNFLIIFSLFSIMFLLFGCTSTSCGDGVCQSGEEGVCYADCGSSSTQTSVIFSVIDSNTSEFVSVNNNIFVEVLNIDEIVDCNNASYSLFCENSTFILDANPKNLELPSFILNNTDSLVVRIGANGYVTIENNFNIEKNSLNSLEVNLVKSELIGPDQNSEINPTEIIRANDINFEVSCKTFGFTDGNISCSTIDGNTCVDYSVVDCYKEGKFIEVWSKDGWDNALEGSAEFDTYAPFYYKRLCNGLAENCVGSKIEFIDGDFNGQEFIVKGFGKDTVGNVFEIKGNSWIEIDTNIEFGTYPGSTQKINFRSIDWNYKLFGKSNALALPVCGNGVVEGNEECDGSAIYEGCTELGFVAGNVGCNSDCTYNTNNCAPHLSDCNGLEQSCTITACEQLVEINNFKHRTDQDAIGGKYVLGKDLDCTGVNVPMIGDDRSIYTYTRKFKGEFDGNGHTISGLNFYRQYTGTIAGAPAGTDIWWENIYVGLFKYIGVGGRVHDLTLRDVNVTGAVKVGGIAGASEGIIERVRVSGTIKGSRQLGGIVGVSEGTSPSTISFSRFDGNIIGKDINGADTGSIIGYCTNGTITSPRVNASVFPREEAKYFGKNSGCRLQHTISYDAFLFNGAFAPLKLKLDGNIARTPYYDTNLLVTIHDANTDEVLVEFIHDFSKEDLNLLPVALTVLRNYQNKNILFVNNLRVQDTKTMFLEKVRPVSKAVCVLNEEVEDVNQLLKECTKLTCPGDKIIGDTNVSCLLDENKFTIFGLRYSGVVEEWECGDNWCDLDENSISCPLDCNEYCGNSICAAGENVSNCSVDCSNFCGNSVCESGEDVINCSSDCKSSGGSSGGSSSGWTTRPIVCSSSASCGEISFIGERYCSGSIVFQKASVPTCINPSRTDSNCIIVEKDLNIMECSSTQTCTNGKCVENKATYDSVSCNTNFNCSGTQECFGGFCKDIVCESGYYPKEHKCFCEGTHCTANLLDDANKITDGNLLNEETAQFDWFSTLFWLFIIFIIIIIIGLFIWFFIIKKKKQEPTLSGPKYF